jgi:CheY-like chemotaxis protein
MPTYWRQWFLPLEMAGHEVIAATTGIELLHRLGQQAPDIVISDYRLAAGETGFDVVRAVRATFGDAVPALIITGDTDPTLMRSMASYRISIEYKPLLQESLLLAISRFVEGHISADHEIKNQMKTPESGQT